MASEQQRSPTTKFLSGCAVRPEIGSTCPMARRACVMRQSGDLATTNKDHERVHI